MENAPAAPAAQANAAPAEAPSTSGSAAVVLPTGGPVPTDAGAALAELNSFRAANSASLFNPNHADHATATARYRALADAAFAADSRRGHSAEP